MHPTILHCQSSSNNQGRYRAFSTESLGESLPKFRAAIGLWHFNDLKRVTAVPTELQHHAEDLESIFQPTAAANAAPATPPLARYPIDLSQTYAKPALEGNICQSS